MIPGSHHSYSCRHSWIFPPEMILGKEYDQSLDWWTLGTLIYELITGGSPFNGFMDIISDSTVQFPESMKISSRAKSLIMGLLGWCQVKIKVPIIYFLEGRSLAKPNKLVS